MRGNAGTRTFFILKFKLMDYLYALDYEYNTGFMNSVEYCTSDPAVADRVARELSLRPDCYRVAVYKLSLGSLGSKLVDQYCSGKELFQALKEMQPRSQSIDRDY